MYNPTKLAEKLTKYVNLIKETWESSEFSNDDKEVLLNSIVTFITNLKQYPENLNTSWSHIVHGLKLEHHPEGGFYRRFYWTKEKSITFYLLPAGSVSSWHRLKDTTETFKYMSGRGIVIPQIAKDFCWFKATKVSQDNEEVVVMKSQQMKESDNADGWGDWYGAYSRNGEYSFVTCECMPPFEFSKFELAKEEDVNKFEECNPTCMETIRTLFQKN